MKTRGQHLLVKVDAELLVHRGDLQRVGPREDAQRDVDHLERDEQSS